MKEKQQTAAQPGKTTGAASEKESDNGADGQSHHDEKKPATVTIATGELENLRKQAAERDEYLDLARRTQAEFQNYQRRASRERDQERQYYAAEFVKELLPVLDNLERGIQAAKRAGETGSLVQGVNLVRTQFLDLLNKFGVTPIEAQGKTFDPNLHEALTQQPTADHPPNTVIHEAERGFMIRDRVLRPAKVVVSSAPEES